jgi:hypothetical protein
MPESIPSSPTPSNNWARTPPPVQLSPQQMSEVHTRYSPEVARAYLFLHHYQAKVFFTLVDDHQELVRSIRVVLGMLDGRERMER